MFPNDKVICGSVCKESNATDMKVNTAKQITNAICRKLQIDSRALKPTRGQYFSTIVQCRYTGNNCSKFRQAKSDLVRAESGLESAFSTLLKYLEEWKTTDESRYSKTKFEILRLIQGHYPKAWHILNRI